MVFAGKSAGVLPGNTILMVLGAILARSTGDLAKMAPKTIKIAFPGRTPADLPVNAISARSLGDPILKHSIGATLNVIQ